MRGWGPGDTRGCLASPRPQTWCGSAAALGGPSPCPLPACGGSGWPDWCGQGMLEQCRAARPRGHGAAEPDAVQRRREPGRVPDPCGARRGWQGPGAAGETGSALENLLGMRGEPCPAQAAFPPPAAVPAGGMAAETSSQGSDPRHIVLGRTVPKPPGTGDGTSAPWHGGVHLPRCCGVFSCLGRVPDLVPCQWRSIPGGTPSS